MGLRDDLQHKVEKLKAEERAQEAEIEAQRAFYRDELQPVMLRAYDYLYDVLAKLQVLEPDIFPAYPFDPHRKYGVPLKQLAYEFDYDDGREPRQLDIRFQCHLQESHDFHVSGKDAVQRHSELLDGYNFTYHRRDFRDEKHNVKNAEFTLQGPLRVHIRIIAHAADRSIYVLTRNLEDLPVRKHRFSPGEFDEDCLERLGRMILREETSLVAVEVDGDYRVHLQDRLEQDRRRREAELARIHAEAEAQENAEQEGKLLNRLQRQAGDALAQARSRFGELGSQVRSKVGERKRRGR